MEQTKNIDEAAVWRRVTGAAPEKGPQPAYASAAQGLMRAMTEGTALSRQLSSLYQKTGRSLYHRLAGEQREENRRLGGLYFFLTGTAAKVQKPAPAPLGGSYPQQLRQLLSDLGAHLDTLAGIKSQTRGKPADTLEGLLLSGSRRWNLLLEALKNAL